MTCTNCGAAMTENICRMTWDCESCPMQVSMHDAYRLGAHTPQEAADLKMADMIYRGWTPYKEQQQ